MAGPVGSTRVLDLLIDYWGSLLPALAALRLLGLSEQMEVLANCPPHTENFFFEYRFAETAHPHCEELITGVTGKDTGKGNVHRCAALLFISRQSSTTLRELTLLPDSELSSLISSSRKCQLNTATSTTASLIVCKGSSWWGTLPAVSNIEHIISFITDRFDGTATILQFANGKEATVDLILACDGIKSPIRKTLYSHLGIDKSNQQEKYAEWVAWRGQLPRVPSVEQ